MGNVGETPAPPFLWEEKMSDEVVPVWDSIRNTCKRWGGIHRNTFLNKYRDRVDTRRLGKKIIVKQVGERSMQEIVESCPSGSVPQEANLQRGTELKRRRRRMKKGS